MNRMMVGCVLFAMAARAVAAEPGAFRCAKDLVRDQPGKENIVGVVLDSDIYAATRAGYADLRVFDAAGKEVPFLVEKATEPRTIVTRKPCASKVASLNERENDLELTVVLDKDSPAADGLNLVTPLRDFHKRVRIYGSDDGAAWTLLVDNATVFDYSRYIDVRNQEIRLPKNSFRQLKLELVDVVDAKEMPLMELTRKSQGGSETERVEKTTIERRPFHIDRIETWQEATTNVANHDRTDDHAVEKFRVEEDPAEKTTIVYCDTRRQPLTELTLETESRNFVRRAEVQKPVTRGTQTQWVQIADGQVSRLDFGDYHRSVFSLSFSERRESQYRIVIHNGDNPPVQVVGVKAKGNVYRAVFLAAADGIYRVSYGSDQVEQPHYDAAAVLGPLRRSHATLDARLGPETVNPSAGQTPLWTLRGVFDNPVVLGVVIVALVAALGTALYFAARRVNAMPKE